MRFTSEGVGTGCRILVKRMRVIEDEDGAQPALFQVGQQLLITGPIILALPGFYAAPSEIHPHELKPRARDHIEVLLVAGDEVNIHPNARRQDRFRDFAPAPQQRKHAHQEDI